MKSANIENAAAQVSDMTPPAIVEAIAIQMDRAQAAKKRIDEEGIVVRDMKGSVIAHPAIKIEIDANKMIVDLIKKCKTRRIRVK